MYYDIDGNQITLQEWTDLQGDKPVRIALTFILDGSSPSKTYEVSTIWVGLDYSCGIGSIQIFETMIFGSGDLDRELSRYSTKEEALVGHREMVSLASSEMTDPIVVDKEDKDE